jgi:hypothetical protein
MRRILFSTTLFILAACSGGGPAVINTEMASGYKADAPEQCVPYARRESGIMIYGDAHSWWGQAAGRRGQEPREGAVLVLASTPKLRYGHLAVVKEVVSDRQIDVSHTNWGSNRDSRRMIYQKHRVEDLSPANDWTSVKFWNPDINAWGLPYAASGFVYP